MSNQCRRQRKSFTVQLNLRAVMRIESLQCYLKEIKIENRINQLNFYRMM